MIHIPKNLKNILVDMDGVTADLEKGFLKEWRAKHPNLNYIPLDKRTTFFPKTQYVKEFGEEYDELINDIVYSEGFLYNLPTVEGAIEALKELDYLGHKVTILTSPLGNSKMDKDLLEKVEELSRKEKEMYIEKHLGKEWIKEDRLMVRKDKHNVEGDYLIDDKSEVERLPETTWEQILFIRSPYNDSSPIQKRMTWKDDYKKILGIN